MSPVRLFLLLFFIVPNALAFSWHDLWVTQNQQAQSLMDAGHYDQAEETFEDPAWHAAAAFRAEHFARAAALYHALGAHYNEGNALAHKGELKAAIQAYDQALSLEPQHADALHNKKIIEALLQQEKDKKNQDKQDQDKQDQDKQDQDKQDQDKPDQDKPDQDKQDQDKQDQDKPDQDKPDQAKPADKTADESQEEHERQQENEQWLRLIPDDPGGLMREKFRRDYLRKQHGW